MHDTLLARLVLAGVACVLASFAAVAPAQAQQGWTWVVGDVHEYQATIEQHAWVDVGTAGSSASPVSTKVTAKISVEVVSVDADEVTLDVVLNKVSSSLARDGKPFGGDTSWAMDDMRGRWVMTTRGETRKLAATSTSPRERRTAELIMDAVLRPWPAFPPEAVAIGGRFESGERSRWIYRVIRQNPSTRSLVLELEHRLAPADNDSRGEGKGELTMSAGVVKALRYETTVLTGGEGTELPAQKHTLDVKLEHERRRRVEVD